MPLIALAPQVAALGGNWDLPKWTWVSALGAVLSVAGYAVMWTSLFQNAFATAGVLVALILAFGPFGGLVRAFVFLNIVTSLLMLCPSFL